MDLFYTGISVFFLITSDSDYTPLIQRLRTSGCQVIGVGNPAKNSSLIPACTRFLPLLLADREQEETLPKQTKIAPKKKEASVSSPKVKTPVEKKKPSSPTSKKKADAAPKTPLPKKKATQSAKETLTKRSLDDPDLTRLLLQGAKDIAQETKLEWILVYRLGPRLKQLHAQFDPKNYGQKNLPTLCRARSDLFECRPKGTHLEVRLKLPQIEKQLQSEL